MHVRGFECRSEDKQPPFDEISYVRSLRPGSGIQRECLGLVRLDVPNKILSDSPGPIVGNVIHVKELK